MSSPFAMAFLAKNPTPKKEEEKKQEEEKPLYSEADWHKVASVNDKYAVDLGTIKKKK